VAGRFAVNDSRQAHDALELNRATQGRMLSRGVV
jgi:hypothetical protein